MKTRFILLFLAPFLLTGTIAYSQASCTGPTISRIRSSATGNWDICTSWNSLDVSCVGWPGTINQNRFHNILSGHTITVPAAPVNTGALYSRGISVLSGGTLTINSALAPPTSSSASIYVSGTLNFAISSAATMDFSTTSGGGDLYVCNGGVVNLTSGILRVGKVTVANGGTLNFNGGQLTTADLSGVSFVVESGGIVNINSSSSRLTINATSKYSRIDGTFDCKNFLTTDAIAGNFQLGETRVTANTCTGLIRTQTAYIPRTYTLNSGVTQPFTASNNFFGFNSTYGGTVEYYGASTISLDNLSSASPKAYYNLMVNTSGGLSLGSVSSCVDVVGFLHLLGGNLLLNGRKCILRGGVTYTASNHIQSTATSTLWVTGKLPFTSSNCTTSSPGITTGLPSAGGTSVYTISKTGPQSAITTTLDIKNLQLRFSSASGGSASIGTVRIFREDVVYGDYTKLTVTTLLQLNKGILRTSATDPDYLYVSQIDSAAVEHTTTGSASYTGFVSGYLKRRVAAGATFDFPVGYVNLTAWTTPPSLPPGSGSSSDKHRRISFRINSMSVPNQDVAVRFYNGLTGADTCQGTLTAMQFGLPLRSIHPEGYWLALPSNPAATVSYDARLYIHSFYGIVDNQFFAVKRPESSTSCADWSTYGLPVPALNTSGRIIDPDISVPLIYKGYAERLGYAEFSHHAIANGDLSSPLPVQLLSFSGTAADNQNQLTWTTASEINNAYFTLEKSDDGIHFQTLAQLPGAGNSNQLLTYTATDDRPAFPVTYYRLQQTDFDGTVSEAGFIAVSGTSAAASIQLEIAGNPCADILSFRYTCNGDHAYVHLTDLTGRELIQQSLEKGSGWQQISLAGMKPGVYLLILHDQDHTLVRKLVHP